MSAYQRKDAAYRAAKQAGLRSRAGVKLEDLDARFHLFAPGQTVIDLGCWPGAWLQVAARRVGERGRVVGVDLVDVAPLGLANVQTFSGNVQDDAVRRRLRELADGRADVVLSDMAPKLTGIRLTDDAREEALFDLALDVARDLLTPDGKLLVKLFSRVESAAMRRLRASFRAVNAFRPPSTRKGSSEIYAMAAGRREDAGATETSL